MLYALLNLDIFFTFYIYYFYIAYVFVTYVLFLYLLPFTVNKSYHIYFVYLCTNSIIIIIIIIIIITTTTTTKASDRKRFVATYLLM